VTTVPLKASFAIAISRAWSMATLTLDDISNLCRLMVNETLHRTKTIPSGIFLSRFSDWGGDSDSEYSDSEYSDPEYSDPEYSD